MKLDLIEKNCGLHLLSDDVSQNYVIKNKLFFTRKDVWIFFCCKIRKSILANINLEMLSMNTTRLDLIYFTSWPSCFFFNLVFVKITFKYYVTVI
jgi:hypothetical protein